MKPDTKTAMESLIKEAREKIPFNLSFDGHCEGRCDECPEKLLEFLDIDLSDWESRLKRGDLPSIGDVHSLGRQCKEIYVILQERELLKEPLVVGGKGEA
ncbi:MAG: hypothetical protein NUV91_03010 [Candidatus Omnitrophica bacterium]|nr:hypothetical protein [Candidatus Omnitrophota bacterium]